MLSGLYLATALLYAVACIVYLVLLMRGTPRLRRIASAFLAAAAGAHVAFVLSRYNEGAAIQSIQTLLSWLALGIAGAFLVAKLRFKITVLGAFIVPIVLLLFLLSGLGASYAPVPEGVESAMLSMHVGANALGIVAMTLAFAAAVAYVVQERLLRRRQLGGVFQRLPALDELDSFGLKAVLTGFPLLTFGMITGSFWILRAQDLSPSLTQAFGVATWVIFGSILVLRVAVGWRGRRAALGTIMGFVCAMGVLAGYVVRGSGGL